MRATHRLFTLAALAAVSLDALAQAPPVSPLPASTPPWTLLSTDFSRSDVAPQMAEPNPIYGWLSSRGPAILEGLDSLAGIESWETESQSGRGKSAANAAWEYMFPFDSRLKSACNEVPAMIDRAETLGDVRAAYLRGMYYATDCGKAERPRAIEPLRTAADRNNLAAAAMLSNLYAKGPKEVRDPVWAYVYAAFVNKRMEGIPAAWPEAWIDRPREIPLSKLKALDRPRATALLDELLAKTDSYNARLVTSAEARKAVIVTSEVKAPGWSYVALRVDTSGECFDNLIGNCRGVMRENRVEIHNMHSVHLQCDVRVKSQAFAGKGATDQQRIAWVAPGATREVALGTSRGEVRPEDVTVACAPIEIDAATKQAKTCRAKYIGQLRVDEYYPPELVRKEIGGVVTVRVLALAGSRRAADVEIVSSSGVRLIDLAATQAVRGVPYETECKYGLTMLKLTFKVQ